jgi:hypothetical protein
MSEIIVTNSVRTVASVTCHYYIDASTRAEKSQIYFEKKKQIKYREVLLDSFNCRHVIYSLFNDDITGSDYIASN